MLMYAFIATSVFLALMTFFCLYRAYVGPTAVDRVVAINVITTKVAMLIVLMSIMIGQESFVDVALIYAMMGFIATICVSKYIEKGKLG
ncbi:MULTISPECIES: monovalent cation/H+ antiporter complex subunit F [Tindallia]|uniref:Multisubunit sodium/proton antiporter, MrpF subunit n=2 Tax=Tindallia TaxID=69894 RepID=A0A1H3K5F1_9FIRM|nr:MULTISPECIES: monovalent cation/H+ antiporter complex subunit F [Tindallia]SDY47430.1 multisubunit sodium/proton antiporter, MrpF subunit [Tindallia californiensis]SFI07986.1 multisubunit sodium/proton antiporter, MrpF subunit [Tindallia magadiensis]